jgi:hypothetical protein
VSLSASTAGWIAIGAVVVAACAVWLAWRSLRSLREVRAAQSVLLGAGKDDLVNFAVALQARIDDLHRSVDEVAAGLARVDRRIDRCLAHTAVVRFDAYEDTGGHQSAAFAFLDGARTGVVISTIQGRDYARIYVKDLERGRPAVALSPEEQEAVSRAMSA